MNEDKKLKKSKVSLIIVALLVLIAAVALFFAFKDKLPFNKTAGDDALSTQSGYSDGLNEAENTVKVTFPEGLNILQTAEMLEENGICKKDAFLSACNETYPGIEISNPEERIFLLEGYILPDTYEFSKNSEPEAVLKKFIDNYNSKITPEMMKRAEELGLTMDEVLTLASIIQKECENNITECANVSSVFHNRLESPSFPKLESDVTTFYIKYDLADYLGYKKDAENKPLPLDEQSDAIKHYMDIYSTYYCKGLSAGPICNPGLTAINAALYPSKTDCFFFLTDPSGVDFYYASTIAQHQENGKAAGLL